MTDTRTDAAGGERPAVIPTRKAFYGIAEIAESLGLNRQLVTVWRRRRSHGMPDPDAELSSGPLWLGETIEPWIEQVRGSRQADQGQPIPPEFALRAGRRMLRLSAVLLEHPIRTRSLAKALAEARELLPELDAAADDPLGREVAKLLAPVRGGEADLALFRARVLLELAQVGTLVELTSESLPVSESAG